MELAIISAFIVYAATLIGISYGFYKKSTSIDSFALGKRSSNYFVTAIATQASDMSIWLMMGFPAAVYLHGLYELWTAFGLIVFMFISWHTIAPRLRQKSEEYHSLTLSGLFARYYTDPHGYLRLAAACISTYFFVCYIASGLVGLGTVFETTFEIPYQVGIVIGLAVTLVYTLLGGFLAVSWANTFQGIFLLGMIILVPLWTVMSLEPSTLFSYGSYLHNPNNTLVNALLLSLSWGIGYFGQPHILTYFMGIDDENNIRYAKYVGMAWQICALTAAASIGILGVYKFGTGYPNPELLFVSLATLLFHPLLIGFMLCAIIAAVLTTMSSHILITGSVLATDVLPTLEKKSGIHYNAVTASRFFSCSASLLALAVAWHNSATIYNLVNYAWSGLGAAFGPLVLGMLYNQKITSHAALAGLLIGSLVTAVWPLLDTTLLPLIPGFLANSICMFVVTKLEKSS